jgi:dihydroneopterin aldolase
MVRMDELFLEGLEVACRVGCSAAERAQPQSLRVDVRLFCRSIGAAARDDDLTQSPDYRVANEMIAAVQGHEFLLIERVAEALAQVALAQPQVDSVEVRVKKRPPVQSLEWAGVHIKRSRA